MRMLDNLKEVIEEIEESNDCEHRFVSDLLIKQDQGNTEKLTDKQFSKLVDIHEKYCGTSK
jgi:hypothetical protein